MTNPFKELYDKLLEIQDRIIGVENYLKDSDKLIQKEKQNFDFIPFDELAKILEPWYKKSSLYHVIRVKNFPKYKIGNKLFFCRNEINKWIKEGGKFKKEDLINNETNSLEGGTK